MNVDRNSTLNNPSMLTVGICIPTFKRPEGVLKLLASIRQQIFSKVEKPLISIFVVDNDQAASAKEIIENLRDEFPYPLNYEIEPQQGIPFVRNRLVLMSKDYDLIAFVDDDEEVIPTWLDELLHAYEIYDAQIVTGPVVGRYATTPPEWAIKGEFYNSSRCASGTSMNTFFTNNTLLERKLLDVFHKPFEESMAFCGGTDSLLAMRVLNLGAKCIWCDEAIVYEDVPETRLTIKWYLRRRYRIGNSTVFCNRFIGEGSEAHIVIVSSVKFLCLSVFVCLSSLSRGPHKFLKGLGYLSLALGMITALLKVQVNEYGRSDYR